MSLIKTSDMKNAIYLLILSGFILSSCEGVFNCQRGDGNFTQEYRAVSSFTSITNSTEFDVEISYASEASLVVEADENLQQYIKTYVQNNILVVELDGERCIESTGNIQIIVQAPVLESAVLSGSGDLDIYDFISQSFSATLTGSGDLKISDLVVTSSLKVDLSGSGDVDIDGKSNKADYYLTGSGDVNAANFLADVCYVNLSGSGDVELSFVSELTGMLSGSGDVYYIGDSEVVRIRNTGSGQVLQR